MSEILTYSNNRKSGVKVFVADNYEDLSVKAAAVMADVIKADPKCILGLATGTSPIGLYNELIRMNQENAISFADVKTYNLDEYYPLAAENDQSYRYFMNEHLFNHVNINIANTHVLNGLAEDWQKECTDYDLEIEKAGGIDIQLLGIGNNGHIGFNEPGRDFIRGTHRVELTESTITANSRLFNSIDEVPRAALTMGVGNIMAAKKVLLIANGPKKAQAIKDTLEGEITPYCQASLLQLHPDVTFVIDKEAAALLTEYKPL
ncbi:MAG: glucosamine-6-phosphate deaminase [Clostridia bacterium]|nr:glucosamine-6-phosphate deaminase [Clostridia bacterium]